MIPIIWLASISLINLQEPPLMLNPQPDLDKCVAVAQQGNGDMAKGVMSQVYPIKKGRAYVCFILSTTTRKNTMAKTFREQIAAKNDQIAKLKLDIIGLEAQAVSEVDPALIVAGNTIVFEYGKAPNRRDLSGLILGVKEADPSVAKSQTLVKVAVGQGFEAQIVTIYPANVKQVTAGGPTA